MKSYQVSRSAQGARCQPCTTTTKEEVRWSKLSYRLTWVDSQVYALEMGGELLTLKEAQELLKSGPICPDNDQWAAVTGMGGERDWVQVGNKYHHPGKSHCVDSGHYPPWGDDTTNQTYGDPTWNYVALWKTSANTKAANTAAGAGQMQSGFHGDPDRNHSFWVYPKDRDLITPRWDTHLDPMEFCSNCVPVVSGLIQEFKCLGHSDQHFKRESCGKSVLPLKDKEKHLIILRAWYGDLNKPRYVVDDKGRGCSIDVTEKVRQCVQNNELHLNPEGKSQYFNDLFFTNGYTYMKEIPIPKMLAIEYRWGEDGKVHQVTGGPVPFETFRIDIYNQQAGLIWWHLEQGSDFHGGDQSSDSCSSLEQARELMRNKPHHLPDGRAMAYQYYAPARQLYHKPIAYKGGSQWRSGSMNLFMYGRAVGHKCNGKTLIALDGVDVTRGDGRVEHNVRSYEQAIATVKRWADTNAAAFWHSPSGRLILKPKNKGARWTGKQVNGEGLGTLFMWADKPLFPGTDLDLCAGSIGGGTWKQYSNIDMCNQGDVEIIHNWKKTHSIDDLKRIVEDKGYSAFTVSAGQPAFGHAALKKFNFALTKEHCKPITTCCRHPCTIYIYTSDSSADLVENSGDGGPDLIILRAWYGDPSKPHYVVDDKGSGVSIDVTAKVRRRVQNNELHLNPQAKPQYLNWLFYGNGFPCCCNGCVPCLCCVCPCYGNKAWIAVPKMLAIEYRWGEAGNVHQVTGGPADHESFSIHIQNDCGGVQAVQMERSDVLNTAIPKLDEELANAAWNGDYDNVKSLIARGARPDGGFSNGHHSALNGASRNGHVHIVRFLLSCSPKPDIESRCQEPWSVTPLQQAAYHGRAECAEILLEHGASVTSTSGPGCGHKNAKAIAEQMKNGQWRKVVAAIDRFPGKG